MLSQWRLCCQHSMHLPVLPLLCSLAVCGLPWAPARQCSTTTGHPLRAAYSNGVHPDASAVLKWMAACAGELLLRLWQMAAAEAWQQDLQASSRFRTFGTGIAHGFEGDLTGIVLCLLVI